MRKQLFLFACLFWLGIGLSYAQSVSISGRVLSASDGQPVMGATVVVVETGQGTITNIDGNFTVTVPNAGAMLRFSFMGYETVELPAQNGMTVRMRSGVEVFDEFIVVGFGTARTRAATVASTTNVSAAQLQNRPVANAMDALQGQVAGLQVFTSSGEPAAMSSIRLFGSGSLSAGTTPLIVVDGMPVEMSTFRGMNPNDFENVTVLRDAAATSIYGSRAANGVIFITTRRGRPGEQGTVRVNANFGVSQLANTNFFRSMMTADQLSDFLVRVGPDAGGMTQAEMDAFREIFPSDTRWYREWFRNAPSSTKDVSISGGAGRLNYFISGGRVYQRGVFIDRSRYERMSFRSNINAQVNNWMRTGINVAVSRDDLQANPNMGGAFFLGGVAYAWAPWFSPVEIDPESPNYGQRHDIIPGTGGWAHLERFAEVNRPHQISTFINTTAFAEITPIDGLTIRSQAGLERMDQQRGNLVLPSWQPATGTSVTRVSFNRHTINFTNTAEYRFTVQDDHNLTFLVGTEYTESQLDEWAVSRAGFFDDRLLLLNHGTGTPSIPAGNIMWSEWAFLSFFGRAEYNFQERIFFSATLRNDASSRFGRENRNAQFWSLGTMWHLHRENFIQDVNGLDVLTTRFSVGTSGNSAIGDYAHLRLVGTVSPYQGNMAWMLGQAGNPRLGWEHQILYTLGFDIGALNNRLRANLEFYSRITSNMLVSVPNPGTTGIGSILDNVGRLANRGVSLRIDGDVWTANRGGSFFTPYVVFNYNRENLIELFHGREYWTIPNTGVAWVVGSPRSLMWPLWAGVNPETGAPQWYLPYFDEFGQPMHHLTRRDPNYITSDFDDNLQQNTGRRLHAPINGGFGFNAGHRGFSLQTDFTFSVGGYLFLNDRFFTDNRLDDRMNMRYAVNDFWTPENRNAAFPCPHQAGGLAFLTEFDDRLLENNSFLRLRNVTLAYSLPGNVLERTNFFSNATVFVTGRNLLTWTNFTGADPEVDSNLTIGMNPNTRQFSVGFDVSF